jgi:hypothetical protein
MAGQGAHAHVLEHGHARERPRDLERPGEPEAADGVGREAHDRAAVEADIAAVRGQEPGEQVEDRRLAGAVGADEAEHLAQRDREVEPGDGSEAAEAPREPAGLEQRGHGRRLR